MNFKAKCTAGERELIHLFNQADWSCIRSAGSGSMRYPSPDLLAGNGFRRVAIECKVTKDKRKYLSKEEVNQLKEFAKKFGAEPWAGIKFAKEPWYFLNLEDLKETPKSFLVSVELAKLKGLVFAELVENFKCSVLEEE